MLSLCHICSGSLVEFNKFYTLHQVTSDCRPWCANGSLAICNNCGVVQKPVTAKWREMIAEIYSGYNVYSQGGGEEQQAFDANSGAGMARSESILTWLERIHVLPEQGDMLDVGCGNGAFLRAFRDRRLGWELTGLELDERNRSAVESIPGALFLASSVYEIKGRFNLITLVHALEHILEPVSFLNHIKLLLQPEGVLLLEVPNLPSSPFDLLIADHCTHFTAPVLCQVLQKAGFSVLLAADDIVPKELTLLARPDPLVNRVRFMEHDVGCHYPTENNRIVQEHLLWLGSLLAQAKDIHGPVGVFGSSISATWLATELGDKVHFFIDEDHNRTGRQHLGLPIFSMPECPEDIPVLMPLRQDIARCIVSRHARRGRIRLLIPPRGFNTGAKILGAGRKMRKTTGSKERLIENSQK